MPQQPLDPNQLRQLEAALSQAEKRGDHLEALDILDDINRRGWSQARHLLSMGNCYMQVRQRQDAKRVWMQAFQMEPNNRDVVAALDKNFAGWDKQVAAAPPPPGPAGPAGADDEPPPPPPPSAFGATRAGLTMDTVAPPRNEPPARPAPAPRAPASPVAPPAARQPARAAAEPLPDLDTAFESQARGEQVRAPSLPPGTLPNFEIGAKGVSGALGKVNWRAVLEEASEIGAAGKH